MTEPKCCQRYRDGLKAIRLELEELRDALSTEEDGAVIEHTVDAGSGPKGDFFAQLTEYDHLPEGEDLYRKVLPLITSLGYASTLVLQRRLEINYRQATSLIADLEREGLIGPAHGFRPHKVLEAAYALCERIKGQRQAV